MKKKLLLILLMVIAATTTMKMAAQDELELTASPEIQVTFYEANDYLGLPSYAEVEIFDEEPDAEIYYSMIYNEDEYYGWSFYDCPFTLQMSGHYEVMAYAIVPGKAQSEIAIAYVDVTSPYESFKIDGIYYYEWDGEIYVSNQNATGDYVASYSGDVVIPDSIVFHGEKRRVYGIYGYAFTSSQDLTTITIPPTVEFIGCYAFGNCDNIETDGLQGVYIRDLEAWCKINFDWTMPETNPLELAGHLFLNGEEVKDLVIPESITEIKDNAFMGDKGLTSVTFPATVQTIGRMAFDSCSGLKTINSSNRIAIVEESAFDRSPSLTEVTLPYVIRIGNYAFADCRIMTSIDLGPYITYIGDYAFYMCTNLERMICRATTPPRFQYGFHSAFETATLYVPAESVEAYRAHEEWGKFVHIVPFIGAGPGDVDGDGVVNIDDVTNLIDQLLNGGELPAYIDVDGDGTVDISDVTALIDMLLGLR